MKKLQFCLVAISMLLVALGAFAQVQNGQFTGTVTDPSGAAIPNAKVTVTNMGTNLSVTTTTNQSGLYTARELPIGTYKIAAEAKGFKTSSNTNLTLNAGTVQRVDIRMELGQAREVVEVTGEAAAVNTEDSKLASTVNSTQIANLPLNGRNVYDLMQLAPGAVNVLGSAWEYLRNDKLDANQFFLNQQADPRKDPNNTLCVAGDTSKCFKPALRFNQFGGTFGGPVVKDKLFFFASFQGDRFRTVGTPTTILVESPEFRAAVAAAAAPGGPLENSVSNLLYSKFKPLLPGTNPISLDTFVTDPTTGILNYTI